MRVWSRGICLAALLFLTLTGRAAAAGRTVLIEFQPATDDEAGLAFLLYDTMVQLMGEALGGEVAAGEDVQLYLGRNAAECPDTPVCLQRLGQRFDAQLAVSGVVSREGSTVRTELRFFSTADGRELGAMKRSFPSGEEGVLVKALVSAIDKAMPDALMAADEADSGGGRGRERGGNEDPGSARNEERRREEARQREEEERRAEDRRDEERREEERRRADLEERRAQEEAERKAAAEERRREDESRRQARDDDRRGDTRRDERRTPSRDHDDDRGRRNTRTDDIEDLDDEPRDNEPKAGKGVMSFSDARKKGMGPSEYRRYSRQGGTWNEWKKKRHRHGRVFSLRLSGGLVAGATKLMYSTTVHLQDGGRKDEEYSWGTTGSGTSGYGVVGLGFSVADFLEVGFEGGVLYGQQLLRREYTAGYDVDGDGLNETTVGTAPWDSGPAAFALVDPRVRVFFTPNSPVKLYAGLGVPILLAPGFEKNIEEVYSTRPSSVLVGIEPAVGLQIDSPSGLGFYVDMPLGILVGLGKADFLSDPNLGGISPTEKEPKPDATKVLFRLGAGLQARF